MCVCVCVCVCVCFDVSYFMAYLHETRGPVKLLMNEKYSKM